MKINMFWGPARPSPLDQGPLNYGSRDDILDDSVSCCSSMSLYSYDSERDAGAFVHEASGRQFNTRNSLYILPSDQTEFARHDKQHRMLQLALGGKLYPVPELVESVLAPRPNDPPAILDLGSGSGAWCIQMALNFPHCSVVGVDLVANASRETPANCRFEFDNINLGLAHFHGQFDLVHSRAVVNGIDDFERYVQDIVACLRPGGIAILAEGDWRPYQEDMQTPYPLADFHSNGGSWWGKVCHEAFNVMKSRGSCIDGADEVEKGLRHPLIIRGAVATYFVPLGPWATGDTVEKTISLTEQGRLMAENARAFTGALSYLFEDAKYPPEITAAWLANVNSSLTTGDTHEYVKYRYAWGIKAPQPVGDDDE